MKQTYRSLWLIQCPNMFVDKCMKSCWKLRVTVLTGPCLRCVYTFMQCEFCFAVCIFVPHRGWSSCWLLHWCLFCCNKAWFKVDQSTSEIPPRPSFPLQPVKMRSLHNIYPGNNDVWFASLLGVSLWGLFLPTAATERENRQKLCPQEKSLRSLFMDDARSVYFCAWPSEWRAVVLVVWLTLYFLAYFISVRCSWPTQVGCSIRNT